MGSLVPSHRHPKSQLLELSASPRLRQAAATSRAASPMGKKKACRCPLYPPTHTFGWAQPVPFRSRLHPRPGAEERGTAARTQREPCAAQQSPHCAAPRRRPLCKQTLIFPIVSPEYYTRGGGGRENEGEEEEEDEEEAALAGQPPPAQPLTRGSAAPALRGSARSLRGGWGGRCSPLCFLPPSRAGQSRAEPGQAGPGRPRLAAAAPGGKNDRRGCAGVARLLRGPELSATATAQRQPQAVPLTQSSLSHQPVLCFFW